MTWLPDGYGRRLTAAGDSREGWRVPCFICKRLTLAMDRTCDACHEDVCDCGTDGDGVPLCFPDASAETWAVDA